MNKILTIGDIHGRQIWSEIVNKHLADVDKIVFLGDYPDPYQPKVYAEYGLKVDPISSQQVIENFIQIIDLKTKHSSKIVLLLGNHDLPYFKPLAGKSKRFNKNIAGVLGQLYEKNREKFQVAYQEKNYLFSHAGLSNKWVKYRFFYLQKFGLKKDYSNMAETLDTMFQDQKYWFILDDTGKKRGGEYLGGPFWADATETEDDYLTGFHQYVGHTQNKELVTIGDENSSITYCDVLGFKTEYKIINIYDKNNE
jgi:predicted phosphodiesterase